VPDSWSRFFEAKTEIQRAERDLASLPAPAHMNDPLGDKEEGFLIFARARGRVGEMIRETRARGYGVHIGAIPGVSIAETVAATPVRQEKSVCAA
jgi:hypothetical protein